MSSLLWFVLWLSLAIFGTYRIARMLAMEDGAFDLFLRAREAVSIRLGEEHWLTIGIHCALCWGFWVALGAALALARQNNMLAPTEVLLLWLGIAGAQTLIHLWAEK